MPRGSGGNVAGFKLLSTPNAPTGLSVEGGIGSATVSFTAPTDTGDAAISSYVVTAVNESTGVGTSATGTSSPITVSPGGGTFKIRMQALNAYGPGRLTEYDTGNAIYSGASLYGWGNGANGASGFVSQSTYSSPVQVGSLTNWYNSVAGNGASLGRKTDGTLWAWGGNAFGQLGDNTTINRSSPVQIGALTNWDVISINFASSEVMSFAIKTDNTLWGWGYNNGGELGDGTNIRRSSPVQIGSLSNWADVSAGSRSAAAVKTDGTLWTWGGNQDGQLGNQEPILSARSSPIQIGALTNWSSITAGYNIFASIKTDGTLWSWGRNGYGQLGDNTTINRSSPIQVGALTTWSVTNLGSFHTGAVKTDGTLWMWGYNGNGRLGDGTAGASYRRSSPTQIGALTGWSSVFLGGGSSFSIKTDGTLWAWGDNGSAQLGLNISASISRSSPVQVGSDTNWIRVGPGQQHTMAILGVA